MATFVGSVIPDQCVCISFGQTGGIAPRERIVHGGIHCRHDLIGESLVLCDAVSANHAADRSPARIASVPGRIARIHIASIASDAIRYVGVGANVGCFMELQLLKCEQLLNLCVGRGRPGILCAARTIDSSGRRRRIASTTDIPPKPERTIALWQSADRFAEQHERPDGQDPDHHCGRVSGMAGQAVFGLHFRVFESGADLHFDRRRIRSERGAKR